MANSLKTELTDKVVIIKVDKLRPGHIQSKCRLFRVAGGLGAQSSTTGTELFGEFLCDGENGRINGYDVERFATDEDMKRAWRRLGDIT